jgi:4a-hydroxytetrahydrobiopterin dehydratase
MSLAEERCEPCHVAQEPLPKGEATKLHRQLGGAWTLKEASLEREFAFDDFEEAMDFVNDVAAIAEDEEHHPDIHIYYNKVTLELSTHNIGGLSRNDFVVAAKIDQLV